VAVKLPFYTRTGIAIPLPKFWFPFSYTFYGEVLSGSWLTHSVQIATTVSGQIVLHNHKYDYRTRTSTVRIGTERSTAVPGIYWYN
jgi:hypothetical protein